MRVSHTVAMLRHLRAEPLWTLLAADKAACVLALLHELLFERDKVLPVSVFLERLQQGLDELRSGGEELPQSAQAYVADWLANGWLTRRLAKGASEEQLELSVDAATAIRFLWSVTRRRTLATESRLATVIQQVLKLAAETDANPDTRLALLEAERHRIEHEIDQVRRLGVIALSDARALERAREVVALADELAGDFRRVRDDFDQLNRKLRQDLVEHQGSRGEVLEALFAGVDLIGESEAGKTFAAFWRLLTDPEQSEGFRDALEALVKRPFARALDGRERKFLANLTSLLGEEGSNVHEVLQNFARSLKSFVQSREFLEQRRLHALLRQATQAALEARDRLRPNQELAYDLSLTSSRIQSVSQWSLYDPSDRVSDPRMADAEPSELGLDAIGALMRQSEIDFRTLRGNVRALLERRSQASIGDVLASFPAEQGLGSVVGYVALGNKHGHRTDAVEVVSWRGADDVSRRAKLPVIYFVRERYDELID